MTAATRRLDDLVREAHERTVAARLGHSPESESDGDVSEVSGEDSAISNYWRTTLCSTSPKEQRSSRNRSIHRLLSVPPTFIPPWIEIVWRVFICFLNWLSPFADLKLFTHNCFSFKRWYNSKNLKKIQKSQKNFKKLKKTQKSQKSHKNSKKCQKISKHLKKTQNNSKVLNKHFFLIFFFGFRLTFF